MAVKLKYLAYGSNLHPMRLGQRTPSARVLDIMELNGYRLAFHKRSVDGSGKCNACYTGDALDNIIGVIYELDAREKAHLDRIEGLGAGYCEKVLELDIDGHRQKVFTYIADEAYIDDDLKPYQWYKDFVALGARYHNMPEPYISTIGHIQAIEDQDACRREANLRLIEQIRAHST